MALSNISENASNGSWREVSRSGRTEHQHPIVNPLFSKRFERKGKCMRGFARIDLTQESQSDNESTSSSSSSSQSGDNEELSGTQREESPSPRGRKFERKSHGHKHKRYHSKSCEKKRHHSKERLSKSKHLPKAIIILESAIRKSHKHGRHSHHFKKWSKHHNQGEEFPAIFKKGKHHHHFHKWFKHHKNEDLTTAIFENGMGGFQNLDEWVTSMAQESIMVEQPVTQDILFGGVDELLVEDETQINSNESVVQRPMSNTSTILSSIHEEQNFDDGMMWPSDTYTIGGSPPVFENIITQQNIYTTTNKSDDLLENELSIINNDNNILLVKGINSSNYSKSLDHIYEDISETSLEYNNNSHLDWNKVGLKSDNNNVMFSPPHLQHTPTPTPSPLFNQTSTSKNVYMNTMCSSSSSSTASSPSLPTTSTTATVLTPLNNVILPTKNIMASHNKLPTLQLDLIPQTLSQKEIIDTPDVINTILACRADEFDLMAYINDDTVDTVISTDVPEVIKKEITSTILSNKPQKRPYTPISTNSNDSSDSMPVQKKSKNSTSYENTTVPVARRGRPPKSRTNSISSEDTDSSKYRELRDKNNEASRRSRINRKVREANMEKEANELERQNIRLTAQVKELDRLVSRMRDALLTTVLKNKSA